MESLVFHSMLLGSGLRRDPAHLATAVQCRYACHPETPEAALVILEVCFVSLCVVTWPSRSFPVPSQLGSSTPEKPLVYRPEILGSHLADPVCVWTASSRALGNGLALVADGTLMRKRRFFNALASAAARREVYGDAVFLRFRPGPNGDVLWRYGLYG